MTVDTSNRAPLVSVITVNRNNASGLRRTLTCLSQQSFVDYEQIVVDGNSSDGSQAILTDPTLKVDRCVSEPDSGVYDAMNKGIKLARGDYLLFLNSGDHFVDRGSMEVAIRAMNDSDIQYFDLMVREYVESDIAAEHIKTYPDRIDFSYMAVDSLPHPATFIRADLFSQYGPYDQTLRICSDWKQFLLWICRYNCSYTHHAIPLSVFYLGGLSGDPRNREALLAERRHVLHTEFPAFEGDLRDLVQDRGAAKTLAAVRQSKVIQLLKKTGLLWDF